MDSLRSFPRAVPMPSDSGKQSTRSRKKKKHKASQAQSSLGHADARIEKFNIKTGDNSVKPADIYKQLLSEKEKRDFTKHLVQPNTIQLSSEACLHTVITKDRVAVVVGKDDMHDPLRALANIPKNFESGNAAKYVNKIINELNQRLPATENPEVILMGLDDKSCEAITKKLESENYRPKIQTIKFEYPFQFVAVTANTTAGSVSEGLITAEQASGLAETSGLRHDQTALPPFNIISCAEEILYDNLEHHVYPPIIEANDDMIERMKEACTTQGCKPGKLPLVKWVVTPKVNGTNCTRYFTAAHSYENVQLKRVASRHCPLEYTDARPFSRDLEGFLGFAKMESVECYKKLTSLVTRIKNLAEGTLVTFNSEWVNNYYDAAGNATGEYTDNLFDTSVLDENLNTYQFK